MKRSHSKYGSSLWWMFSSTLLEGKGVTACPRQPLWWLVIEVDVHVLVAFAAGKSGGGKAILQAFRAGDANAPVVEVRARAAFGGEHLLPDGIVDHPGDDLARLFQAERDVEHGEAVGEIGGAVQGIDKPAVFRRAFVPAAFFGHDAVRGKVGAEAFDDQLFAGAVGLGHEVEIAFQLEGHAPFEIVGQQGARLARDLHGCFQVRHALGLFRDVLDVVFENEKVGFTLAGQADEGLVVILDDADHFLAVFQLDSDRAWNSRSAV